MFPAVLSTRNYFCVSSCSLWLKLITEKEEGSHGLHQDSFKLHTMTALMKSFCGGGEK